MYAVIFEVTPHPERAHEYFDLAAELRPELERIDGFISIERFQSLADPERYVSLSFWRDEAAIREWQAHLGHQTAQDKGKAGIFKDFRIRVARVERDYTLADRT
ncbi:MAG: antibiotic biosynthesis monooxygenase [Rhodospirillales bacterium CG15_BIG_FIL_POST_REV_8_21_14_020_66_15]|nr:MAG: antibiotic biosynthesis monooxygenase [Rhodospirillales bacterium CG15_BIG_FIL_POST_REV_8_21_14_020_66_15]